MFLFQHVSTGGVSVRLFHSRIVDGRYVLEVENPHTGDKGRLTGTRADLQLALAGAYEALDCEEQREEGERRRYGTVLTLPSRG